MREVEKYEAAPAGGAGASCGGAGDAATHGGHRGQDCADELVTNVTSGETMMIMNGMGWDRMGCVGMGRDGMGCVCNR